MKKYIVIHDSAVGQSTIFDQFNNINQYHRDVREFPISSLGIYVGYHRLITGQKNYKCRIDDEIGAHCNQEFDGVNIWPTGSGKALSMNIQSLGVCVGMDGDHEFPYDNHYNLLREQVWKWQDDYKIPNENVFFHRKFNKDKTCPGSLITQAWLDKLLLRSPVPTESCVAEKVELEKKVSNLQSFINLLLGWLNKK